MSDRDHTRAVQRLDDLSTVHIAFAAEKMRRGQGAGLQRSDDLYDESGIAAVIVDRPAEDAMAPGFVIKGEGGDEDADGGAILNEIDRLDAVAALIDGLKFSRLGAGAILMLAADAGSLTDELNLASLKRIEDLVAYPSTSIAPGDLCYQNPSRRNYGEPVTYRLDPANGGQSFDVHESRLLRIPGPPRAIRSAFTPILPWAGRSVLELCGPSLRRYKEALDLSVAILERKQQPVHHMQGLSEMIAAGLEDVVKRRLALADLVRGVLTTVGVDGGDKYDVLDASVGGIDTMLAAYRLDVAAHARMPVPVIFGEGLSGLGNSGSGEQAIYHGTLNGERQRVRPALERLVSVLWAQQSLGTREPDKWRIVFNPLWSPSEAEMADVALKKAQARKAEAETLVIVTDGQMVTQDEGREFIRSNWSDFEIKDGEFPEDEIPEPVVPPVASVTANEPLAE